MAMPPCSHSTQKAAVLPLSSHQLVLVIAPDRGSQSAQLRRFERAGPEVEWKCVGDALSVSLGRSGLAWGRGLHPAMTGTVKCEGDGGAPAGIFAITALFGVALPGSEFARAVKLPYLPAALDLKAIDDPASRYYNRIVDQSAVPQPDWGSCEDMLRDDLRYAIGAVVAHNAEPVVPGAGSCIFLHVWAGEGVPTAGCTAMALADMGEIAGWLDGAARPLLVQLAQTEYDALGADWGLPSVMA